MSSKKKAAPSVDALRAAGVERVLRDHVLASSITKDMEERKMKIFYPTILTPAGYVLFAGLTMTPERENEVAHRANARAFLSFVGREPMDAAEVSAWVREVLA